MQPPITQVPIQRFTFVPKFQPPTFQKQQPQQQQQQLQQQQQFFQNRQLQQAQSIEFDGKRLRKAVTRKTVDYNSAVVKYLEARVWQRDYRDRRALQPDSAYYTEIMPPLSMLDNPINAVTTKFVRTSTNKMRCPIFCVAWTPEGRRLVTGASSGEFTLWNGLTFNFETILQAHDSPVRCMVWSHNDIWMVTGDHAGYVKYWQSNMNNVKMFQAHKEPVRGISFCPIDTKFTTCSDDGTVRIWDFLKCFEEKILRGHGADVKCVDWHPQKALIVSGSKDSQQPIKLWDPKSGQSLATIHAHKNTVMDSKWNKNGNWLLTASRDHLIKLFDIRNMKEELQTFRGHKKEATTLSWHPVHEGLFASGGSDGSVMFWCVGADKEVGAMEQAHDSCVWSLAWHPLGHILCSGSNDHMTKFWTRNRPGDRMRDKYNLNTLPKGQEDGAEYDDSGSLSAIPGMGLEYGIPENLRTPELNRDPENMMIPGLDLTSEETTPEKVTVQKKTPFSKPIPKQFQQQWMESKQPLLLAPPSAESINAAREEPKIEPPPPQHMGLPPNHMPLMDQNHFAPPPRFPPPPPHPTQFNPRAMEPPSQPSILGDRPRDMSGLPPPPRENFNNNSILPGPPKNPYSEEYSQNEIDQRNDWRQYNEEHNADNGYGPEQRQFRDAPPSFEEKDLRFNEEAGNQGTEEMDYNWTEDQEGHYPPDHSTGEFHRASDFRGPPDRRPPNFRGPPPPEHRSSDFRGPSIRPPDFRGPPEFRGRPENRPDFRGPPENHPSGFRGPPPPDNRSSDFRGPPPSENRSSDFRGPPPDNRSNDFRGPPPPDNRSGEFRGQPPEFSRPPRPRGGGPMFYSGRGQRGGGSFRGNHSPYRMVNPRGRGGRGGFKD